MTWPLPLVGRDKELAELERHLAAAAAGRGGVALVSGLAGIGKTFLVNTLAQRNPFHCPCVTGYCTGPGETAPFGPWVEALSTLQGVAGQGPLPLPSPYGRAQGQWGMRDLAVEMAAWLNEAGRPVLVVLEDIHWADPASLDLLRQLQPQLRQRGGLVLATYRSEEVQRDHPLWTLVPELQRAGATLVPLRGLELADVVSLVRDVLPGRRNAEVEELATRIHDRTAGHPLFVRELILSAAGQVGRAEYLPLPNTVRQAIDAILNRLSPQTEQVLEAAAIVGERFTYDLLAALVQAPEPELAAALDEALAFLVIQPRGSGDQRYLFTHALVREALVSRFPLSTRRALHRRIAEEMLRQPEPDLTLLAYHLVQGGDARAPEYLLAAGDHSLRLGAFEHARRLYEQALTLVPASDPRRGELLLKAGHCLNFRDNVYGEGVGETWEQALAAAREAGDRPVAVWARFCITMSTWWSKPGAGVLESMAEVAAEQETLLDDPRYRKLEALLFGQAADYPSMAVTRAQALATIGRLAEARQVLAELQTRSEAALTCQQGYAVRISLAMAAGQLEEVAELTRRMMEDQIQARRFPYAAFFAVSRLNTLVAYRSDHPDEIDAAFAQAGELQAMAEERSGATYMDGFSLTGVLEYWRGDWEGARRNLVGYLQQNPGDRLAVTRATAVRLLIEQGDLAGALSLLAPVFPLEAPPEPAKAPPLAAPLILPRFYALRAEVELARHALGRARDWLEAADRRMTSHPAQPNRPYVSLAWARYHRLAGNAAAARGQVRAALAVAQSLPDWGQVIAAHRLLGELVAEQNQAPAAAAHFRTARQLAEQCRFPYEVALTQLARGQWLPGSPGAWDELAAARETFARLGAQPALHQAGEALKQRVPVSRRRPGGLTQREMEVARQVSEGLTDKEIGIRLGISPSTVDAHLRKIFAKTKVRSRAALVSRISEGDPP